MELMITIPDEQYEYIKELPEDATNYQTTLLLYKAVKEGAPHIKTNYYGVTTALLGREGTQSLSADVENIPHHYLGKLPMFSLYPNNQEENT